MKKTDIVEPEASLENQKSGMNENSITFRMNFKNALIRHLLYRKNLCAIKAIALDLYW